MNPLATEFNGGALKIITRLDGLQGRASTEYANLPGCVIRSG